MNDTSTPVRADADPGEADERPLQGQRPETNRDDLVAVFGTGVKGLNYTGDTVDMLRLNYSIPVTPAAKSTASV